MLTEELEFRISQYADGTLPADELAALEAMLATDGEVRAALESYRKLDVLLKRELPLPAINFDRLAEHLSDAVAESDRPVTIKLFTWTRAAGVAVAAMLVIAIGSVIFKESQQPTATPVTEVAIVDPRAAPATATTAAPIVEVTIAAAPAASPAVEEVAIGPSPAAQRQPLAYAASEDIIYRVPRVVIASTHVDRQDTLSFPF